MATRRPPRHGRKQKTYVVFRGRVPGIYESWPECQMQVEGFSSQAHQAFNSKAEAEIAWANYLCTTTRGKDVVDAIAGPNGPLVGMVDNNMEIQNMGSTGTISPPQLAPAVPPKSATESCIPAFVVVYIVLALLLWLAINSFN